MNNHQKRLLIGFFIAVGVLTALFLLLEKTPLAITAYCFSLLAPAVFFGMLWQVASGNKGNYITNAAFPLCMYPYCLCNLAICGSFTLLDQFLWSIPVGWFIFVHIVLIAFFAWRFLTLDAGREEIERIGKNVRLKTVNWKMIAADVESLKNAAPNIYHQDLQNVIDAIRYADPVSCEELANLDDEIKDNITMLEIKLRENKDDEIKMLCLKIQRQIKERNTKSKILK